jgi:hypothetical protein
MPEKRIGTCDICGRHNVERMLIIGGLRDGRIDIAWACSKCRAALSKIREEMANHGEGESQERTPRE